MMRNRTKRGAQKLTQERVQGKTMKTSVRLRGVLFALCALLAGALPAHSAVLVGTQGSSFFSLGVPSPFQPLADVVVGDADKSIGGFGVYGAAEAAGEIRFVVFDNGTLLWQSAAREVSAGSATWHDIAYTDPLLQGHTYTMGLLASNVFAWGQNTDVDEGFGPIGANGLQIMPYQAAALLDEQAGFLSDPSLSFNLSGYQTSVRVFDIDGVPPIPEPAEWSMLLAGLLVVAFVANRRRPIRA
jgi:hypothetical protein